MTKPSRGIESETARKFRLRREAAGREEQPAKWQPGMKVRFKALGETFAKDWEVAAVSESGLFCKPIGSPGARPILVKFKEVKIIAL